MFTTLSVKMMTTRKSNTTSGYVVSLGKHITYHNQDCM